MIEIGKVANAHGVRGELKIQGWCDDIYMYEDLNYIYIGGVKYDINNARVHKGNAIVKCTGVDDINAALLLREKVVEIERERLGELADGVYYVRDLLGLTVRTEIDATLGKIVNVIKTGSNDVYELDSKILIPALADVVLDVDLDEGNMTVKLPKYE